MNLRTGSDPPEIHVKPKLLSNVMGHTLRTGDTVWHEPSGETWVVAYVDGADLVPLGWPMTYARISDCHAVKFASDAESHKLIIEMAQMQGEYFHDPRASYARRRLGITRALPKDTQ